MQHSAEQEKRQGQIQAAHGSMISIQQLLIIHAVLASGIGMGLERGMSMQQSKILVILNQFLIMKHLHY